MRCHILLYVGDLNSLRQVDSLRSFDSSYSKIPEVINWVIYILEIKLLHKHRKIKIKRKKALDCYKYKLISRTLKSLQWTVMCKLFLCASRVNLQLKGIATESVPTIVSCTKQKHQCAK